MAVAIVVMIVYTTFDEDEPKQNVYSEPSGLLYGCPTLTHGTLLTFDDSPTNETAKILDLLEMLNVTAVFFISNLSSQVYPEVTRRLLNSSHAVGLSGSDNGTFADSSTEKLIKKIQKEMNGLLGDSSKSMKLLRPNTNGMDKWTIGNVTEAGYTFVLYNLSLQNFVNNSTVRSENRDGILRLIDGRNETIQFLERLVRAKTYYDDNTYISKFEFSIVSPNQCFGS